MPRMLTALVWSLSLARAAIAEPSGWTPGVWTEQDTLDLTTNVPGEGSYSFPVWLVVLDDEVYVRLGARAAKRVQQSADAPRVGVTVAGAHFDGVRCEPVPDLAPRVAEAIAQKYWSDVFIRFFPHPVTCRLVPG